MNIVLWIPQVLVALAFLAHGWLVLSPARDRRADERVAAAVVPALPPRRGRSSAAITPVLLALATFVAYMRHRVRRTLGSPRL